MSRASGFLLRSSRRVLAPVRSFQRSYTIVGENQPVSNFESTERERRSGGAAPSTFQHDGTARLRYIPNYDSFTRRPTPELKDGVPDGIELTGTRLRIVGRIEKGEGTETSHTGDYSWQFDHVQLRDSCACPLCVDLHSGQRTIRTSDIPSTITPRSVQWDGQKLVVQWADDIPGFDESHTSTYDAQFLRLLAPWNIGSASRSRLRYIWSGKKMEQLQHWITYDEYMNDDVQFTRAMRRLAMYGLIFVKDIPDSRDMVERLAARVGPLRNTFYGQTWDVREMPGAKNIAYTSQPLGMHMDLMYMNEPPGYQLLHCLRNSAQGGESLFADTFRTAIRLYERRPHYFDALENFRVNYQYVQGDQVYFNSWPVIEAAGQETNAINSENNRSDKESNGNEGIQKRIIRVNYSPPFQAPFHQVPRVPGFRLFRSGLEYFANDLEREWSIFERKLQPGECAIFENRRVAHGRHAFDPASGERWLAGAYLDEDVVLSRFGVLRRDEALGRIWARPGVFTGNLPDDSGEALEAPSRTSE